MCKTYGKAVYSWCVSFVQMLGFSAQFSAVHEATRKTLCLYSSLHTFCTRIMNTLFALFQSVTLVLYPSSTGLITMTTNIFNK